MELKEAIKGIFRFAGAANETNKNTGNIVVAVDGAERQIKVSGRMTTLPTRNDQNVLSGATIRAKDGSVTIELPPALSVPQRLVDRYVAEYLKEHPESGVDMDQLPVIARALLQRNSDIAKTRLTAARLGYRPQDFAEAQDGKGNFLISVGLDEEGCLIKEIVKHTSGGLDGVDRIPRIISTDPRGYQKAIKEGLTWDE